jgi:hypothetical protein
LLGYDLNGDGIGGDRPFLNDPSILGRSISNARIDPATYQLNPNLGRITNQRNGARNMLMMLKYRF